MDVLAEVHDEAELDRALALGTRADRHQQPRPQDFRDGSCRDRDGSRLCVPKDRIVIAESGIFTHADLDRLAGAGVGAFLVGESLMRADDVAAATRTLLTGLPAKHQRGRAMSARRLSHINKAGEADMVNVSAKAVTDRSATAEGFVAMAPATLDLILGGKAEKGDVLATARIAGIMAAKRTSELIPLCHPLPLTQVTRRIHAVARSCRASGRGDGEGRRQDRGGDGSADRGDRRLPHALRHGARQSTAACEFSGIRLVEKTGGRSGVYRR